MPNIVKNGGGIPVDVRHRVLSSFMRKSKLAFKNDVLYSLYVVSLTLLCVSSCLCLSLAMFVMDLVVYKECDFTYLI